MGGEIRVIRDVYRPNETYYYISGAVGYSRHYKGISELSYLMCGRRTIKYRMAYSHLS